MKKIGIITFHFADNYGAVLQTYALSKVLNERNTETEIINYIPFELRREYDLMPKFKYLILNNRYKDLYIEIKRKIPKIFKNISKIKRFNRFREEYLNLSKAITDCSNGNGLKMLNYDVFITGSDQVWTEKFFKHAGFIYFLDFASDDKILMSYAASMSEEISETCKEYIKPYLERFDYISVRESSSKSFIQSMVDIRIETVLDPTLLLSSNDWCLMAKCDDKINNKIRNRKYILVYDLTKLSTVVEYANRLSDLTGYKIVSYSDRKCYKNWIASFYSVGPEAFLYLIKNADLIVTTSFHGTIFSALFNKVFYTVPHPTRGSRMTDFLKSIGLEKRIINPGYINDSVDYNIDYEIVNRLIQKYRNESLIYLFQSIEPKETQDEYS